MQTMQTYALRSLTAVTLSLVSASILVVLVTGVARAQDSPAGEPAQVVSTGSRVDRPLGAPVGPPLSGPELERVTEELASEMRCPVCQGLSIAASRSISALNMKTEVRNLLAEGYSPDQVLDYFEQSYGEFVRLTPKARGFNLLVWILPLAGLALGVGMIAWQRGRKTASDQQVDPEPDDPYFRQVLQATSDDAPPAEGRDS